MIYIQFSLHRNRRKKEKEKFSIRFLFGQLNKDVRALCLNCRWLQRFLLNENLNCVSVVNGQEKEAVVDKAVEDPELNLKLLQPKLFWLFYNHQNFPWNSESTTERAAQLRHEESSLRYRNEMKLNWKSLFNELEIIAMKWPPKWFISNEYSKRLIQLIKFKHLQLQRVAWWGFTSEIVEALRSLCTQELIEKDPI